MGKQRKKTPLDMAEPALAVVEKAIGEKFARMPKLEQVEEPEHDTRYPAAVALCKLGASKGERARAKALSPKKRAQVAKLAANTGWKK